MGENTAIEWARHTFNPWMGCTKVSEACRHCYAERDMDHRWGKVAWGPNGTRVMTSPANWRKPLKWNREAAEAGERPRVFCASLADVFEGWQGPISCHYGGEALICQGCGSLSAWDKDSPCGCDAVRTEATMGDLRGDLFRLIDQTPHLDWLLLTKRPERVLECWPKNTNCVCPGVSLAPGAECDHHPSCPARGYHRENAWLGTSVENCDSLHRIDDLRRCRDRSPVLFLSCEPLLEDLGKIDLTGIDWVIAGGESGPDARPSHPWAFASLANQCIEAGVPFFFKQWGEWMPSNLRDHQYGDGQVWLDGRFERFESRRAGWSIHSIGHPAVMLRVGKKAAGRLLDGREWHEIPGVRV